MQDPALVELLKIARATDGPKLWLADEHHSEVFSQLKNSECKVLTNRFDIHQAAGKAGLQSIYNDWDIPEAELYQTILLRICKEKPVNRHLAQQAQGHLAPAGRFIISGQKSDGIKSFQSDISPLFISTSKLKKVGPAYLSELSQPSTTRYDWSEKYTNLSPVGVVHEHELYSKPGVYGWEKIDLGSQLLAEQFQLYCQSQSSISSSNVLDLGCGYGYLTLAIANLPFEERFATDNNAAAVNLCRHNSDLAGIRVQCVSADCADQIDQRFDYILCNPPFHKGFDVDSDLTLHFLIGANKKLKRDGSAFFVTNSFIGIEKKAVGLFKKVESLCNTGQFKVLKLSAPTM